MSKGHPALTPLEQPGCWRRDKRSLTQNLMASAQPLLMSHSDLGMFLQHSCLQIWALTCTVEVFRDRRVRHCFQHPLQKQGAQMLQAPLTDPSYSSSTSAENGQIFSIGFFSWKTSRDAEQINLRESTESQRSHLGKPVCVISWGRGVPDTFTRASSLHQQQKAG